MTDADLDAVLQSAAPFAAMHPIGRSCFALIERLADEARRVNAELAALSARVLTGAPHPSHIWNGTVLNCCIQCGEFAKSAPALLPCDPSKLAGKLEYCCECAAEYPRSDLIAGHIYCEKHRAK